MRSGFFISCRLNRESNGLGEIVDELNRLVECPDTESIEKSNFKQCLEEEIKEYKNRTRFVKYSSHKSIVFLENRSGKSSLDLFYRLRDSNVTFEYVYRVVPLEYFFHHDDGQILRSVGGLDGTKTYKILYEERLCTDNLKEIIFNLITNALTMKVDLVNPYYIIAVQAYKNKIGISTVINERKNFNFSPTNVAS